MDTTARDVAEQGQKLAEEKLSQFQQRFEKGKEAAMKYASQAKDSAGEYARQARDVTQERIRENPFWSMLAAVGLGVGIGLAVSMFFGRSED